MLPSPFCCILLHFPIVFFSSNECCTHALTSNLNGWSNLIKVILTLCSVLHTWSTMNSSSRGLLEAGNKVEIVRAETGVTSLSIQCGRADIYIYIQSFQSSHWDGLALFMYKSPLSLAWFEQLGNSSLVVGEIWWISLVVITSLYFGNLKKVSRWMWQAK